MNTAQFRSQNSLVRIHQAGSRGQIRPRTRRGTRTRRVAVTGCNILGRLHQNVLDVSGLELCARLFDECCGASQLRCCCRRSAKGCPSIVGGCFVAVGMRAACVTGVNGITRLKRQHDVIRVRLHADEAAQIRTLASGIVRAEKTAGVVGCAQGFIHIHEHTTC